MDNDELKKACLQIMGDSEVVYVTSVGEDGYPYTRSTFNLRNTK